MNIHWTCLFCSGCKIYFIFIFRTFITKWTIENRPKNSFFLQIGAISLHFKILENVYTERKPTRFWLKLCCAFLLWSTWDANIMVTFWLQLSDKVTFEEYRENFFRTFHVNIFFILRNKRLTCKQNNFAILCHSV